MAKKFGCLFIFLNILQMLRFTSCENDDLQQKFTTKCEDLCENTVEMKTEESGKSECLRGCQYFNIEFLTNARSNGKIVDLNQLVEKCGSSCSQAYTEDKAKKEKCFTGCNEMMTLQAKAPYINGWLVYMGATDRHMVLLQPDFDVPSKEDWILLDSMFQANDYDYDPNIGGYEKILTQSRGHIQTVPIYTGRQHFTINYCIPTWMWMVPLILLIGLIWIHYSNYIYSVFVRDGLEQEFGISSGTNVNGAAHANGLDKKYPHDEDFVVGTDFYFYPSPAIPPPKYNEAAEAILMGNSSDEEDTVTTENNKNCVSVIKANDRVCSKKYGSVVDI